jgi:hypothetical protein
MSSLDFRPAYPPAGHDFQLRIALRDLRSGRWSTMRELLETTPGHALRTHRTQVLAAAAAGTDLVQAWRCEEPRSALAAVMHGRVAVERALRARYQGHQHAQALWRQAWGACRIATRAAHDDPVPWVCLLALARLDERQEWDEHRTAAPEPTLPSGPWGLLAEADRRDPHNREAYHRMLQFLCGRPTGGRLREAGDFARWAAAAAPAGSPLHVLPLYVRVERYRREGGRDAALDLHWVSQDAGEEARRALHRWFDHTAVQESSLLDLGHLAHGLWGALEFRAAARVFRAMDPYYTPWPWAYRTPDPGDTPAATDVFVQARARCLAALQDPRGA